MKANSFGSIFSWEEYLGSTFWNKSFWDLSFREEIWGVTFLIVVYICTKFRENIFDDFEVTERT